MYMFFWSCFKLYTRELLVFTEFHPKWNICLIGRGSGRWFFWIIKTELTKTELSPQVWNDRYFKLTVYSQKNRYFKTTVNNRSDLIYKKKRFCSRLFLNKTTTLHVFKNCSCLRNNFYFYFIFICHKRIDTYNPVCEKCCTYNFRIQQEAKKTKETSLFLSLPFVITTSFNLFLSHRQNERHHKKRRNTIKYDTSELNSLVLLIIYNTCMLYRQIILRDVIIKKYCQNNKAKD